MEDCFYLDMNELFVWGVIEMLRLISMEDKISKNKNAENKTIS